MPVPAETSIEVAVCVVHDERVTGEQHDSLPVGSSHKQLREPRGVQIRSDRRDRLAATAEARVELPGLDLPRAHPRSEYANDRQRGTQHHRDIRASHPHCLPLLGLRPTKTSLLAGVAVRVVLARSFGHFGQTAKPDTQFAMASSSKGNAARAGLLAGAAGTGLTAAALGVVWHRLARRPLPKQKGTIEVAGLRGPVRVRRDRWGVPHIEAERRDDLYFAQGFCHGQDRLWQMDFYRRVVRGRVAEMAGPEGLPVDRLMRTLGIRRAAEREAGGARPGAARAAGALLRRRQRRRRATPRRGPSRCSCCASSSSPGSRSTSSASASCSPSASRPTGSGSCCAPTCCARSAPS